jgi:hypothetical protein
MLAKKEVRKMGNVVEKCLGIGFDEDHKKYHKGGECCRIDENGNCLAYLKPSVKWDRGKLLSYCPLASHYDETISSEKVKTRVGQQKGKKGKKSR